MHKNILVYSLLLSLLTGCTVFKSNNNNQAADKELNELVQLMEGKFSSALQAQNDSSYFNISLVMTTIWPDRTDGKWLYVEQAVSSGLDKPYRQRVYHLQHPAKDTFTSDIYTIQNPLSFAGLQNDKTKADKLTFKLIDLKEGCTVTLVHKNDVYEGGTYKDKCPSDLRGATYATTKITLKKGELISWDQGFDSTGKQVWGATKGGYIFIKQ